MINELQTNALTLAIDGQKLAQSLESSKSEKVGNDPEKQAERKELTSESIAAAKPDIVNVSAFKQGELQPPKVPGDSVIKDSGRAMNVIKPAKSQPLMLLGEDVLKPTKQGVDVQV